MKSTHVPPRPPEHVMRLARLGRFHQCRLSFLRQLTRRWKREGWRFSRPVFDIGPDGIGHAVYTIETRKRRYSLVAFAHDLPDHLRSDRVIAEAWDATFTLFDGLPSDADIERLRENVPLQEAGRITQKELTLSRTNRSARTWDYVVDMLSRGRQPDPARLAESGYLMRTTAVYGSGKFGAADHCLIAGRSEFAAPFQAEMLTVFLVRAFVRDLVNHSARTRGGQQAVELDAEIAQGLGIGNSTGLGMAPFIVNHPKLFSNWILARETALSRVRSVIQATTDEVATFRDLLARAMTSAQRWQTSSPHQSPGVKELRSDLRLLAGYCGAADLHADFAWDRLFRWAEDALGLEAQECVASLMLEPYGDLVDDLCDEMADTDPRAVVDGSTSAGALAALLAEHYGWAAEIDWDARPHQARAWYTSVEKLEPRLGERFEEPIEDYEQPLAPAREASDLMRILRTFPDDACIADVLDRHPEHRSTVRRAEVLKQAPYGEIRDNTIGADLLPIDMLRCKLSFFGATHFDPRSDRWVRITMFQNAPYPEDIHHQDADRWVYPAAPPDAISVMAKTAAE